jgi:hypothetical protein
MEPTYRVVASDNLFVIDTRVARLDGCAKSDEPATSIRRDAAFAINSRQIGVDA